MRAENQRCPWRVPKPPSAHRATIWRNKTLLFHCGKGSRHETFYDRKSHDPNHKSKVDLLVCWCHNFGSFSGHGSILVLNIGDPIVKFETCRNRFSASAVLKIEKALVLAKVIRKCFLSALNTCISLKMCCHSMTL